MNAGACSYRSMSATGAVAQQQTSRTPLLLSIDGADTRTDGRTPDRYVDPAPHTRQAVSMTSLVMPAPESGDWVLSNLC